MNKEGLCLLSHVGAQSALLAAQEPGAAQCCLDLTHTTRCESEQPAWSGYDRIAVLLALAKGRG